MHGLTGGKVAMKVPDHAHDDILTLTEISQMLRLDRKTVVRIASEMGGMRFGRRW